jgi:hypothetical protein
VRTISFAIPWTTSHNHTLIYAHTLALITPSF